MRRIWHVLGMFVMLAVLVPGYAADDKNKDADQKEAKQKDDVKKDADKKPDDKKADDKKDADKKDAAKDVKKPDADKKDVKKADADKKVDKKAEADKKAAKLEAKVKKEVVEKIVTGEQVTGKITVVETSTKIFTVQVTRRIPIPNPAAAANMAQIRLQLVQAYSIANPIQRQQQIAQVMVQMQQAQRNAVTIREEAFPVQFEAGEDMKVRLKDPPLEFDDKGKPKKYTLKELRDLKGPGNYWGFPGDFESLRTDQIVTVYLPPKPKTAPARPTLKKKDKDADNVEMDDVKYTAVLVYILAELKK